MTKTLAVLICGLIGVFGCDQPRALTASIKTEIGDPTQKEYCGGEMPAGTMSAYFRSLKSHLDSSAEPVPLSFYNDTIGLTGSGETVWFRTNSMGAGAERLPTRQDWLEISRRGASSVRGAGWRGCRLSLGKVSFNTDSRDGTFGLAGFNRDIDWSADD